MATAQSIRDEFQALSDHVLELETFADISSALAGDNVDAPKWPFLVSVQVRRINESLERLETTIRTKALPVIEDLDRVTRR